MMEREEGRVGREREKERKREGGKDGETDEEQKRWRATAKWRVK